MPIDETKQKQAEELADEIMKLIYERQVSFDIARSAANRVNHKLAWDADAVTRRTIVCAAIPREDE